MNLLRACAVAMLLGASSGCKEISMAVRVVATDGGDPFGPPDAATQARFRLEDQSVDPVTVGVASNGYFALETSLSSSSRVTRGIVEALRMGDVVGGGATPPLAWNSLGPSTVSVFVQRRDTVVEYAWRMQNSRTSPSLFEVAPTFVVALGGTTDTQRIESFNELTLEGAANGSSFDQTLGRDASFVRLASGNMLVISGCMALIWNPASNDPLTMPMAMSISMPPAERCDIRGSTVVQEPGGGALLLGGRGPAGPVARVDLVNADGSWATALPMAAPRVRPAAVRTGLAEALIAGGQDVGAPFLERYTRTLAADRRPLRTGMSPVDDRRNAALIDLGNGVVLALGGSVLGSTDLTANDVVLDANCLDGSCPLVVGTPVLLRERRRDPVAALADEGRVVVASGAGVGGVAASVELIDASSPRAPVNAGAVGALPYDGLTALRLATGNVLFVGGGTPVTWVYRH